MAAHRPLILIADDESKIRRLVSASLEMAGFDVCTAADGEEALETFERLAEKGVLHDDEFDLVLEALSAQLSGLLGVERFDVGQIEVRILVELLGEVVTDSTEKNLQMRVDAENGATAGKFDLAKRAKALNLDAIHDTVHEMARDEARHGKAFEGLLKRYFNK